MAQSGEASLPARSLSCLSTRGVSAGLVAGTAFILAQMCFSAMLGKSFLAPPHLVASIVLGQTVVMPGVDDGGAGVLLVGFVINYALSIAFGIVSVALLAMMLRPGTARALDLVGLGFLSGMIVWIVDFYVIAPFLFPQFAAVNQFWGGFVAHAIFGLALGATLATRTVLTKRRTDPRGSRLANAA